MQHIEIKTISNECNEWFIFKQIQLFVQNSKISSVYPIMEFQPTHAYYNGTVFMFQDITITHRDAIFYQASLPKQVWDLVANVIDVFKNAKLKDQKHKIQRRIK